MTNLFHPYPEPKLTIELVPSDQWSKNLRTRSIIKRETWDALRYACYARANNKCEVCGGVGPNHPVEAHEVWDYNDDAGIQKLLGLVALCPDCHKVKHIGFAFTQGLPMFSRALSHLEAVNNWPIELVQEYVSRQFQIHQIRSQMTWELDLSWLADADQYIEETGAIVRQRRSDAHASVLEAMTRKR